MIAVDDTELVLRYSETFQLPPGTEVRQLLDAFERVSNADQPHIDSIQDLTIRDREGWRLGAEVITPTRHQPYPVAVYVHGGGWTTGTPRGYRRVSCELAARGYLVITPDYRRAPRHRFPAALDDCHAALDWAMTNSQRLGGDPRRLVVVGDSAGANLAAACLVSSDYGTSVRAALLFYGIFDYHDSLATIGPVVGGANALEQLYLPVEDFDRLREDPRVRPILAAERLPPSFIAAGSKDPLAAQSMALSRRLADRAGVDEIHIYDGDPHGFLQLPFTRAFSCAYDDAHRFADGCFARHEPG